MSQALWMRLRNVEWIDYQTSTGDGERLPRLLQDISSRKISRALKASHMVWKLLCSNGIHPAAEPTIPFLIELSQQVTVNVKLEILDILKSCALSLSEIDEKQAWQEQCWNSLAQTLPLFRKMRNLGQGQKQGADSEFVTIAAESIIKILEQNSKRN